MDNFELDFLKSVERLVASVPSPLDSDLESIWKGFLLDFSFSLRNVAFMVSDLHRKSLKK